MLQKKIISKYFCYYLAHLIIQAKRDNSVTTIQEAIEHQKSTLNYDSKEEYTKMVSKKRIVRSTITHNRC